MTRRISMGASLLAGIFVVGIAAAQAFPPHRFFGTVTIDGQPAPTGTVVRAFVGSAECASAMVSTAGTYVIDIPGVTINAMCGRAGQSMISFRVGDRTAVQMPTYRDGGFEQLNLTIGPAPPAIGYNAAEIVLDSPCVPEAGQNLCNAERLALWEADREAWARRGVTDTPPFIPFEGRVFEATVIFRVENRDPAVIRNIAQILGNPFLQITFIRFSGNEYVEITNLGGGPQDMSGWSLRSPDTSRRVDLPAGLVLQGGQSCRIYSNMPQAERSCGPISFNTANAWPDTGGRIVLYYDALDLPGDEKRYSADPASQPPPPNLRGLNQP